MKNVSASIVICERVLNEVDGVMSAIRLAEIFNLAFPPQTPIEQVVLPIAAAITVRLLEHDELEHSVETKLFRPDGDEATVGEPIKSKIAQKVPGVPGGINIILNLGVKATQFGLHSIAVFFDQEEVARAYFTLARVDQTEIPGLQTGLQQQ